jgi:ferredoxin--NADP+ reductase
VSEVLQLPRAAVLDAVPSGFYAADRLIRAGIEVDLFDALPTPHGLVRAGVAPDHLKIKSVVRMFERTAQDAAAASGRGVAHCSGGSPRPPRPLVRR